MVIVRTHLYAYLSLAAGPLIPFGLNNMAARSCRPPSINYVYLQMRASAADF